MKNQIKLALLSAWILGGCGVKESTSEVAGALNEKTPTCSSYSAAQISGLEQQIQGLPIFQGFTDAEKPELLKHLYAIPKVYRDQVIEASRSGEFEGFIKQNISASGTCYGGKNFCSKVYLSSTQKNVIGFSFIHESGHGLMSTVARGAKMSNQALENLYTEMMEEGKAFSNTPEGKTAALRIRAYSFSGVHEFWADSFHNYYCSPEANDFIKKYLPKNYAFLSANMPAPSWIAGDGETGTAGVASKKHAEDLVSLYNSSSKSCDLEVQTASAPEANGAFSATLLIKGGKKTIKLDSKLNDNLSSELFRLKLSVPTVASECAV